MESRLAPALMLSSAALVGSANIPSGPTSGTLQWNGSIESACSLNSFVDGVVVANSSQKQLSSKLSGGAKATAVLYTNAGGFQVVTGTPELLGPSGVMPDVTIDIETSATGVGLDGSPLAPIVSNPTGLLTMPFGGAYSISSDAVATRGSGQSFDAGQYVVRVPISCARGVGGN